KFDQKFKVQEDRITEKFDQKFKVQEDRITEKFDQKFKVQEDRITEKFERKMDEKIDEVLNAVNEGFTGMQGQFNELKNEMAKRPTKEEVFSWADRRIVDLELAKDRHDFMHIDELDKLPAQSEISKTLAERGFKQKITQNK
ncbi:hypothetical protein L6249_02380, partial [Candidatus Parcubacteria bacterium]|nr:hypothetical protein [Candidatus Parcubacteria bacterium]